MIGFVKKNRKGEMRMKKEKWYERFHDDAFISYYETGEAEAVYIVRDLAKDVDTTGKWIDVVSASTFGTDCEKIGFNRIIVELFPRITRPDYGDDVYENRYLCWHAAHKDIALHRSKNHHGEKFLVLCKLCIEEREIYRAGVKIWRKYGNYVYLASHKIKQKKIEYINRNAEEIILQIKQKGEPTLSMFHIV